MYGKLKEKILEITKKVQPKQVSRVLSSKDNKELLDLLIKETSFLGKNTKINERVYCVINDIIQKPLCKECNKKHVLFKGGDKGYGIFCSVSCSRNNVDTQEKQKKSNLEKFGVEYASQNNEIKDKIKKNYLKKYGVESNLMLNEVKEKIRQTNIKKYGCINPLKINPTNISIFSKYFVSNKTLSNRVIKNGITPCLKCHPFKAGFLGIKKLFVDFIKDIYKGTIIENDRKVLGGKKIDILLIDLNIGIEIHGLYWHSDEYKDKNYHHEKMKLAKEKGIQLFQFFDDEIPQAMMLIYSTLLNKHSLKENIDIEQINNNYGLSITTNKLLKYQARKLILKSSNDGGIKDKSIHKDILNTYHVQGSDTAKHYYSLEDEKGNILSIMTFKVMSVDKNQKKSNKETISKKNEKIFELSRYVTIPGIQIIGGFSRLLKAFKKDMDRLYQIDNSIDLNLNNGIKPNIKILTYSNLRYSDKDNNVYSRNGFELQGFTGINYYYFFEGKKMHRFNFRKNNLYDKILPERGIEVNQDYKKESENGMVQKLIDNGYEVNKVFDAGHLKWFLYL